MTVISWPTLMSYVALISCSIWALHWANRNDWTKISWALDHLRNYKYRKSQLLPRLLQPFQYLLPLPQRWPFFSTQSFFGQFDLHLCWTHFIKFCHHISSIFFPGIYFQFSLFTFTLFGWFTWCIWGISFVINVPLFINFEAMTPTYLLQCLLFR